MSTEAKVLSAVLKDGQIHHLLQANVGQMMLTHGDIWKFISDYYSDNGVVPSTTLVSDKFSDFNPVSTVGSTKHHLAELQKEFTDHELRSIIRSAVDQIQNGSAESALKTIINETSALSRYSNAVKDIDLLDTDSTIEYFKKLQDEQANGLSGIKTNLNGFDACMPNGIQGGQLGVFLAFPGIGKSFLALYLAVQAWLQGKTPMIISLEMTEAEVRNRLLSILGNGRWSLRKLSKGEVDIQDLSEWHERTFKGRPSFHIISGDGLGTDVTPQVVRGKIDQYKPDLVILDYLQLMTSNSKAESEVVKMKNLSRELKLIAIADEVPIVAISSATPDDATDLSQPPALGQTAWSRQIAYDSDFVIALGRDITSDIMQVVGRKNRNGMTPDFLLQVDFDKGLFIEKEWDDEL